VQEIKLTVTVSTGGGAGVPEHLASKLSNQRQARKKTSIIIRWRVSICQNLCLALGVREMVADMNEQYVSYGEYS
jgi:hypothetical protein